MSQWTHVVGCIRVDALVFRGENIKSNIEELFGKCVSFNDPGYMWDDCSVPLGSEGSVQYNVERTSEDDSSIAWGVIYIWGDLRDYSDYRAIYNWINNACKTIMVRSCCVKIDVEFKDSYLVYDRFNRDTMITEIECLQIA
jgi:hypothetical protein